MSSFCKLFDAPEAPPTLQPALRRWQLKNDNRILIQFLKNKLYIMIPNNTDTAPAGILFPGLEDDDTKMRKNEITISTKKITFLVKYTFVKYVQHNT